MDIQKSIADIIGKIKTDKSFAADFSKDPIKAVESVIGVDLPDEKLGAIVDGVKAQMALESGVRIRNQKSHGGEPSGCDQGSDRLHVQPQTSDAEQFTQLHPVRGRRDRV